jgi:hypothetical protein
MAQGGTLGFLFLSRFESFEILTWCTPNDLPRTPYSKPIFQGILRSLWVYDTPFMTSSIFVVWNRIVMNIDVNSLRVVIFKICSHLHQTTVVFSWFFRSKKRLASSPQHVASIIMARRPLDIVRAEFHMRHLPVRSASPSVRLSNGTLPSSELISQAILTSSAANVSLVFHVACGNHGISSQTVRFECNWAIFHTTPLILPHLTVSFMCFYLPKLNYMLSAVRSDVFLSSHAVQGLPRPV